MPISAALPVLASGLQLLFEPGTTPPTTHDAARMWADAIVRYATAGGVPAEVKRQALASALEVAFQPAWLGAGIPLFLQALVVFWMGLPVPQQLGVVVIFVPLISPIPPPIPPEATPAQQAQSLANQLHALTLGAAKVQLTAPPNPIVPLL